MGAESEAGARLAVPVKKVLNNKEKKGRYLTWKIS